jgi:riboflavin synthase
MENFESYSLLLATIAQRMLGSRGDVEDIVQEAYLRYATAAVPEIGSLKAYLMTIVTHLCLDQRKSARLQREQPLGLRRSLVPEDIEETAPQALEQREAISQALLLLLECLTSDERAVFLLHDVFSYPYEEIARVVGKRPATCRQLAHRAKTRLIERRPRFVPSQQAHHHLLDRFLAASQQGDLQVLLDALVKDMMEQAEQERQGKTTDASSRMRRKQAFTGQHAMLMVPLEQWLTVPPQRNREQPMFTGLVEEIGTILCRESTGLLIHAPSGFPDVTCKEHLAVDGVCLTVIERGEQWFHVETMPETLRYTRLGCLQPGAQVNLERALPSDGPISGHFVQGHIEATVAVLSVKEGSMARYCEVERPAHLRSSIIPKGLIILNGVTLTVLECQPDRFSFALIPYAWEHTNLGEIHPGTVLNLETYMVQALQQDGKSRDRESGALYPASNWFLGNEQRYSYPVHSAVSRTIRGSIRREESEDSCVYD